MFVIPSLQVPKLPMGAKVWIAPFPSGSIGGTVVIGIAQTH